MAGTIVSFDPGGTTGIAIRTLTGELLTMAVTSPEEAWDVVIRFAEAGDVVIVERFATAGLISKYGLLTTEIVGGIKALCQITHATLVVKSPQQRKAFQDLAHAALLDRGLKPSSTGREGTFMVHEEDALAHLLAWEYFSEKAKATQT